MKIVVLESTCPIVAAKTHQSVFYVILGLTPQQVVSPQATLAYFVRLATFPLLVLKNAGIVDMENTKQVLEHQQNQTANFVRRENTHGSPMHLQV